jgi:hypothetical protein
MANVITDTWTVCYDCTNKNENGEDPSFPTEYVPLSLLGENEGITIDTETYHAFVKWNCDACGSHYAGERFDAVLWEN